MSEGWVIHNNHRNHSSVPFNRTQFGIETATHTHGDKKENMPGIGVTGVTVDTHQSQINDT